MVSARPADGAGAGTRASLGSRLRKDFRLYGGAYLLMVPVVLFYILFCYKPMYGLMIAFKDFSPAAGILGSDWAASYGFQNFIDFFGSYYFWRLLKNTLTISLATLVFGFPAPILLALLLNEVKSTAFKRVTQTISYMPHFISLVVVCSLVKIFTADTGAVTSFLSLFGLEKVSLLSKPQYFVPVYVLSNIWQEVGWGPSYTWRPLPAWTRSFTKRPASTGPAAGSRQSISPCRGSPPPSSSCCCSGWAA